MVFKSQQVSSQNTKTIHDRYGLLCFLLNIKNAGEVATQANIGAIWETFVYSEIRRRQLAAFGSSELFYYRDRDLEVDFLQRSNGQFILREAKWSENPNERDFAPMHKVASLLKNPGTSIGVICRTPRTKKIGNLGFIESLTEFEPSH